MDFYGCHFEYAGQNSRKYNLVFANVETSRLTSLSGTISTVSQFSKKEKRNLYIATAYDDSPLQFEAEVVSETPIDARTQREIEKWLFHRVEYRKLYMDLFDDIYAESYEIIDDSKRRFYLNCRMINPTKLEYNGGIIGYRFTIECDSGFLWQEPVTKTFTSGNITLYVDTDTNDYVYPRVTVVASGTGSCSVTIINNTDNSQRHTALEGLTSGNVIILDGKTNYVSGSAYDNFTKKNFVRLLDGENRLTVSGNFSQITFEWQNMRYL